MIRTSLLGISAALTAAAALAWSPGHPARSHPIKAQRSGVTYAHDIAPILDERCVSCHRTGQVAPFSLETYADAKRHAPEIAAVTQSRLMPPWKADSHGEFENERKLTPQQIAAIQAWASGGTPQGPVAETPPIPKFSNDWQLGHPDAVYQASEDYHIPADGPDIYRCFVIPSDAAEDRYVSAIDVRPGNRAVVHHVIAYLDTTGKARELDAADPGPGYTSYGGIGVRAAGALGGWAPGITSHRLPDGEGVELPKGADIVLQVHYHPSGKPETDRTQLALYFAKGPVDKRVRIGGVFARPLDIPPGDAHYETGGQQKVPADITVLGVAPHMHLLGHDMTVTAQLPDGSQKPLVMVPDWDFNWQAIYYYKQPISLPKGSVVSMTAHYDNSAGNPRNPNDPPKQVGWGERTTDEMGIAFFWYTVDSEHLTKGQSVPVESAL